MFTIIRFISYAKAAEKYIQDNMSKLSKVQKLAYKLRMTIPQIRHYLDIAEQFLDKVDGDNN